MTLPICSNPVTHTPTVHMVEQHHTPPTSWRRLLLEADPLADQSWWRTIPLCSNCHHGQYHRLLDDHIRHAGVPPWELRRTFSVYIRPLVAEAWNHRPSDRPPFTLTST